MSQRVSGGCKCGLVRYEGARLDVPMFRCHCLDCQKLTGSGHSEMMALERDTFSIGADCRTYEMLGGSGQPTFSGFCPMCGSQLTRHSTRMSDRVYVHAASLDDPGLYSPAKSLWAESAQPWDAASIIAET